MSDTTLRDGQVLIEHWEVHYKGQSRLKYPSEGWVECRVVNMFRSTIYGGANGTGKTVEEARLEAVLGLARAICDDSTAFDHDADEIFKAEQYRWWLRKLQELRDEVELFEDEDEPPKSHTRELKRLQRRIKSIEQLMGEWQEEHDYWPEAQDANQEARRQARTAQIRADTAKRRAASTRLAEAAASGSVYPGTVVS